MREAAFSRKTKETHIEGRLHLDGTGQVEVATGIGFFDHMLTAWAFNAMFDLELRCEGDLHIDQHHTVEDVGIALGEALAEAWGDKSGLTRYGACLMPMDEALVRCVIDCSGRAYVRFDLPWEPNLGATDYDYALTREFHWGVARAAKVTTHIDAIAAGNNHHMCEASFKAFGRALREAVAIDSRRAGAVPSTKGSL